MFCREAPPCEEFDVLQTSRLVWRSPQATGPPSIWPCSLQHVWMSSSLALIFPHSLSDKVLNKFTECWLSFFIFADWRSKLEIRLHKCSILLSFVCFLSVFYWLNCSELYILFSKILLTQSSSDTIKGAVTINPCSYVATQMSKWNGQKPTLLDIFHLQVEAWYKDPHSLRTFSIQQLNDLEKTNQRVAMTTMPLWIISASLAKILKGNGES